ncbi:hypothetical protein BZG29_15745 [Janthinobacterium sp. LM6]|uniref:hypothetical protein n=1 Tax=Janthinobacterium sp. LM6 TaxID=1938606 RepID=UPI000983DD96|nr:hypothetical protein [Janthinobacterium sp. LM6]AQR69620.1 hypothetical protein BZG29_15745 [Janthinobacterium sp. LM6]
MNKHHKISEAIEIIATHKNQIINHIDSAWGACDFSLSEPKIIKSFVMDKGKGVDYLNINLAKLINDSQSRFVVKFGGVYTHQRPYIVRTLGNSAKQKGTNPTEKCELADLLCLHVFVDSKKNVITSQASFFQAKKTETIDNATQRWLYDLDDKFSYDASSFWENTSLGTDLRTMPSWEEQRSSAFQYLLLLNNKPNVRLSPWSVDHKHKFSFFLYRLLTFSAGKTYDYADRCDGGWSSIVNDVLRMGGGAIKGKLRNSPNLDEIIDYFNDFRNHDKHVMDANGSGVPMLLSIVQDTGNT